MAEPNRPNDQLTVHIPRSAVRAFVGVFAAVAAFGCGWFVIQLVDDWINGAWRVCTPIVLIGSIAAAAWTGWRKGWLRRFRLWTVLSGVVALVVLVPVGMFGSWVLKETVELSKGEPYASSAVFKYFMVSPLSGKWSFDQGAWWNLLCNENQDDLEKQANEFSEKARLADWPDSSSFSELASDEQIEISNDGEIAKVKARVQFVYANVSKDPQQKWLNFRSPFREWTFDLVNDNGWRICGLSYPDPCTALDDSGYSQIDCDARARANRTSPSASPD